MGKGKSVKTLTFHSHLSIRIRTRYKIPASYPSPLPMHRAPPFPLPPPHYVQARTSPLSSHKPRPRAMADYFADIGIVDAHSPSAARNRSHIANGSNGGIIVCHALDFGKNSSVFYSSALRRLPRFMPNSPCAGANPPPASTGTGVFLPHPEV